MLGFFFFPQQKRQFKRGVKGDDDEDKMEILYNAMLYF